MKRKKKKTDDGGPMTDVEMAGSTIEQSPPPSGEAEHLNGRRGERGILILALGHPYYGELAANLAASIRFHHPEMKIALCWHGKALKHLNDSKKKLFSQFIEVPDEMVTLQRAATTTHHSLLTTHPFTYFKAKTHIYDLSPFEHTLFLDADMLWLRNDLDQLFDELKDVDFTIQHRSFWDLKKLTDETKSAKDFKYHWADLSEIKKVYGDERRYYQLHSELIYFRKSEKAAELFATIKEMYVSPGVKPATFAGDMADELAFSLAMMKHDFHPHKTPWQPVYWYLADAKKGSSIDFIKKNYSALSVGGSQHNQPMEQRYNTLSHVFARRMGVELPFKLKAKRSWLPERKAM